MTVYGLTAEGFVAKPLAEIKAEIEADLKTTFGATIDLAPQETLGQIVGIVSERLAELWDLGEAVYNADNPDAAGGVQLDEVAALTGTVRAPPSLSKVTGTATGTFGTVLAAGRVVSVAVLGYRFESIADATILAEESRGSSHLYSVVGERYLSGTRIFQVTTAGTSAASAPGGLATATQGGLVTDGTAVVRFLGAGTGSIDVEFVAQIAGPENANAGTLTTIETPVSGWSNVYNLADQFHLGTVIETDAALRIRREQDLRAIGNSANEAIRQTLLAVPGVTGCTVFENDTDATDGDGLPPHSIEVLVSGDFAGSLTNAAVRAAIFASKGAGIETYGQISGTVTDSSGTVHTIKYTRPTQVLLAVSVELYGPVDEVAAVMAAGAYDAAVLALLAFAASHYSVGLDVSASRLTQFFFVPGVESVYLGIGINNHPDADTDQAAVVIGAREIAVFDSARIYNDT